MHLLDEIARKADGCEHSARWYVILLRYELVVIVIKQKCLNPPKSENERERQEIEFDWKGSFLTLRGILLMPEVF